MSASSLKKATLTTLAAGALAALGLTGTAAAADVRVGTLECSVAPSVGLILGSTRNAECLFRPDRSGKVERYHGLITRVGLDVGFTGQGYLTWAVFASTNGGYVPTKRGPAPGILVGDYGGVTAQATVGVGLGANVLVGGSNRTIALQPLSVEAQTGLNLAAGVAGLKLYN